MKKKNVLSIERLSNSHSLHIGTFQALSILIYHHVSFFVSLQVFESYMMGLFRPPSFALLVNGQD
jgi:hypothetical protein